MNLFDSHSHYNDEKFDIDRDEMIKETLNSGVSNFIVSGYNIGSSKKAIQIAKQYDGIYAIGDGAGITRGLMQASVSGVVAARDIVANMKK